MKTIWGLILIVAFGSLLFGGVSVVNNQIIAVNSNLDSKSLNISSVYDSSLTNLSTLSNPENRIDPSLSSNTTNQVDAFFRESAENKNNVQKFFDGLNYIFFLPDIILLSLPIIDTQDTGFLLTFRLTIWFLLSVIIGLVLYKGIRTGKVDDEG